MKEELNALNTNILGYKTFLETKKKESEQLSQSASIRSTKINDIKRELSFKKEELNKIKSKLDVIEEIKSKKTNLAKGTHNIVENSHLFRGYKALVSELIEVNEKYALAIETILSSAMQHIVVDKPETAVEAINFLKSNNGGRATFIPLSSIKPKFVPEQHIVVAQTQKGFLGIASELVSTEEQYNV